MGVMYVYVTWSLARLPVALPALVFYLRLGPSAIRCWPSESHDVQPGAAMPWEITPLRGSMCLRLAFSRVQG